MGAGEGWLALAGSFLVSYAVLFLLVPFLSACFIHQGFEKFKVPDVPFARCVQACFFTSSANIVCWFVVNYVYYAARAQERSPWVLILVYSSVQIVLVPLLIHKRSWRALLIEIGGLVLANLCGYGVLTLLFSGSAGS